MNNSTPNRYWLFMWETTSAQGGWFDMAGSHATLDGAKKAGLSALPYYRDRGHILDRETMQVTHYLARIGFDQFEWQEVHK